MTEEKKQDHSDKITLIDEEGRQIDFELMDVFELDRQRYAVLMPLDLADTKGALEEDEAVIFRLDTNEEGEEYFSYIEDDKEWDFVVNTYNDMLLSDEE